MLFKETLETQTDTDFTEYIEPNVYNQESITVVRNEFLLCLYDSGV